MARFRLVETNEEGNVIREFYCSPMFPGDERNEEFRNNRIECIQGFSKKLHFNDYNSCPQLELQVTYDDKEWNFLGNPVTEYYNL